MFDALPYFTVGLLLALVLRKPARRLFGAGPAFTLWALPLLLAALPYLPALPATWAMTPTTLVLPSARAFIAQATPAVSTTHELLPLWLTGAALCLLHLIFHYARLMRQTRSLPAALMQALRADLIDADVCLDSRRLRLHPNGPAVLWAPRSLLLIPPDFIERFDALERQLVLRHEYTHLRRGDTWWSLLAELAFVLLWFHPLAWLAMPRFRLDQELACDERVLRQSPQDETRYAHTLLHSIGADSTPVLIPWLAEPQLKERLIMIERFRPGALRRHIGFVGLTALMLGGAVVAHAGASSQSHSAQPDIEYNSNVSPKYPADAVKNHEQGTVILIAQIGTDGTVHRVKIDPATQASPSLVKAASDAVMNWHFNPEIKNGKPVAAYTRIPVNFSLHDDNAPANTAPPAAVHASTNI